MVKKKERWKFYQTSNKIMNWLLVVLRFQFYYYKNTKRYLEVMPEAVPASGRVWTVNGYRHVNTVSQFPSLEVKIFLDILHYNLSCFSIFWST